MFCLIRSFRLSVISIISIIVAVGGLFVAYKTFLSQKGEVILQVTNLPFKKHIGDLTFEENIPEINLKIINTSGFPITIENVYLTLGNPESPEIYSSKHFLKSWEHKYITFNPEFKELDLNIIKNPIKIESSHAKYISLVDDLIRDNFCSKYEHFCLVIKNIRVIDSIGQKWVLSSSDELRLQEYTYSFQTWKNIQEAINTGIQTIRLYDNDSSDKEVKDKVVKELKQALDI